MIKIILLVPLAILFVVFYRRAKDKNKFLVMCVIMLMPLQLGLATGHAPGNGKTINAIDFILILMLLRGIPKGVIRKKLSMSAGVFFPGLLFIFWAFLSMIIASEWKIASGFGLISCIRAFFIGYYIANFIRNKEDMKFIVKTLTFSLLFICSIGIAQYFTHSTMGLGFIGSWGMRPEQGWLRATGTFRVPNVFAAYLIFLLPVTLAYSFLESNKVLRFLSRGTYGLGVFAVVITFSRSSWLGLIVSTMLFLFMFIKDRKLRRRVLPLVFMMTVVGIFVIFRYWETISTRAMQGVGEEEYMDHRRKGLEVFPETLMKGPILGAGQWASKTVAEYTVHVTVLRIAIELGVPGLIFFLWILKDIYKMAFKVVRSKDKYLSSLSIGIMCGFTAFMILSCFNPTYRFFSIRNLFWFFAGLLFALRNLQLYDLKLAIYQKKKRLEERPTQNFADSTRSPLKI